MEPRAHRACKDEQGWAGLGPSGEPPERGERGRGCRAEHGEQSTEHRAAFHYKGPGSGSELPAALTPCKRGFFRLMQQQRQLNLAR